jgi:hypothetical protein
LPKTGPKKAVGTFARRPFPGGIRFDGVSMRLRDTLLSGNHGFTCAILLQGITSIWTSGVTTDAVNTLPRAAGKSSEEADLSR